MSAKCNFSILNSPVRGATIFKRGIYQPLAKTDMCVSHQYRLSTYDVFRMCTGRNENIQAEVHLYEDS